MTDRSRRTRVDAIPLDPIEYPWEPVAGSGVLHDGHFEHASDVDALLSAVDAPPLGDRHAVVAVGSNASPAVMHRKLSGAGVSTTVAMTIDRVHGVAVGHSAHVSMPGYIAAAPYLAPDRRERFVVVHLDEDQLDAVDATEPNYRRVAMATTSLYASVWGVLAVDGVPIDRCDQRALHRRLADADRDFAVFVERHDGDPALALAHDGEDPWRHRWAALGFVMADGFPAAGEQVSPPATP